MNTIPEMQAKLDALRQKPAVRILAMESSCDETAAAIIENGRTPTPSMAAWCRRSPAALTWMRATGWWIRR